MALASSRYCESRIFRMHSIFVYFVYSVFRRIIKCVLKVKTSQRIRSGQRLYKNFMRTKGRRSPAYESLVRTNYSGFTVSILHDTIKHQIYSLPLSVFLSLCVSPPCSPSYSLSLSPFSLSLSLSLSFASRKDRRKKFLLNTNRTFRPHGLPQQNREQSGEERSYIPVPRQRDIGAPVPGTVKRTGKGGGGSGRSEGIGLTHAHGEGGGGGGYIPVPRHQCTGARYGKSSKRGSRRNEEIGLTHAQGENEKCRN